MKLPKAQFSFFTITFFTLSQPSHAEELNSAKIGQTILASTETQDFSRERGSLNWASIEYKLKTERTTVTLEPTYGERRAGGWRQSAAGVAGTIYHNWSSQVSTRTQIFAGENKPVFAHFDVAQDLTVKVAKSTTATVGGRWARYFGGQDVNFLSLGARRYFKSGSIGYRLTRVKQEGQSAFFSHLLNFTINDGRGEGRTQVWLSTGAASLTRTPIDSQFAQQDFGALIRRIQPLSRGVKLLASGGYSSYAQPIGRIGAKKFGLGVSIDL